MPAIADTRPPAAPRRWTPERPGRPPRLRGATRRGQRRGPKPAAGPASQPWRGAAATGVLGWRIWLPLSCQVGPAARLAEALAQHLALGPGWRGACRRRATQDGDNLKRPEATRMETTETRIAAHHPGRPAARRSRSTSRRSGRPPSPPPAPLRHPTRHPTQIVSSQVPARAASPTRAGLRPPPNPPTSPLSAHSRRPEPRRSPEQDPGHAAAKRHPPRPFLAPRGYMVRG